MPTRVETQALVEAAAHLCDEADKRGEVPWVAVEALRAALDALPDGTTGAASKKPEGWPDKCGNCGAPWTEIVWEIERGFCCHACGGCDHDG
jgi:hypothetical protein